MLRRVIRNRLLAKVLVLTVGLLAWLAPVQAKNTLRTGIVFSGADKAVQIDPSGKSSKMLSIIKRDLFETLVHINDERRLVGGAATSWEYSEDKVRLTFHLRRDSKWSDGEPVTAHDFIYSFGHWADAALAADRQSSEIVGYAPNDPRPLGVRAIDDYTLEIEGVGPYALDPAIFALPSFAPLPRHVAPATATYWSTWERHPSNGPYALDSIGADGTYHLSANPHARAELRGQFDEVIHTLGRWKALAPKLVDAKIDVVHGFPSGQVEYLQSAGFEVVQNATGIYYYAINAEHPKLTDPRVRQAIGLAVNVSRIRDAAFHGSKWVTPASAFPPGSADKWGMSSRSGANRELARKLMREAGYSEDTRLELSVISNYTTLHERVAGLLRQDLAQIFINLEPDLSQRSFPLYKKRLIEGKYEIARYGFTPTDQSLKGFLGKCQAALKHFCGFFEDETYAQTLIESTVAPSKEAEMGLLKKASVRLMKAGTVIPIVHRARFFAHSSQIRVESHHPLVPGGQSMRFSPGAATKTGG